MGLLEFSLSTYPFSDAWREPRSNRAISEIRTPKTFSTQNLHIRKFFCNFAPESYAGGRYVLRKAFRKGYVVYNIGNSNILNTIL